MLIGIGENGSRIEVSMVINVLAVRWWRWLRGWIGATTGGFVGVFSRV